ncbi:MAG: hypothetical protein JNN20_15245 [Betaproteobacteria bacterium]|nr:hypothetical protein [Betaproteobacteria bacterium]
MPPGPHDRAGVAFETLQLLPLNVRRVMPEQGHSGWYVWGGETRSSDIGFFQSLPVARLLERCPHITPFLALAPGWRVQWTSEHYEITPPLDSQTAPSSRPRPARSPAYTPYRAKHERVTRYVVLSILLHTLAFALLGDTGGERGTPGRGGTRPAPGGFQATLQAAPNREVVATAPTRSAEPSRRRTRSTTAEKNTQDSLPPTAPIPAPTDAAAAPATTPTLAIPTEPLMPPLISTPVEKAMSDFVVPQVTESKEAAPMPVRSLEPLPKLEPIAPPKSDRAIAVPAELIPRLAPITPPKPTTETALPAELIPRLAPIAPVKIERESALPAELVPRLAPLTTPKINSETAVPAELVPRLAPIETPRIKTDAAVPAELVPRLAPLTTPKVEREIAVPAELIPRLAPITAPPAMESLSPATIERPAVTTAPSAAAASPAPARNDAATNNRQAAPNAPGSASNRPAAPGPDGDIFGSRAGTPGASGTGTPPPRIDLDAVRQRARELAGESAGPRTLLPFPTVKPKDDAKTRTQTQQAFDKALKRPDCRDVYANMGLAAVVPLVVDAVTEKGCKW